MTRVDAIFWLTNRVVGFLDNLDLTQVGLSPSGQTLVRTEADRLRLVLKQSLVLLRRGTLAPSPSFQMPDGELLN